MDKENLRAKACAYDMQLKKEERSKATRRQYSRDIEAFITYLQEQKITKERVIGYKERLVSLYQPSSVNAKLAAVNGFLKFLRMEDCRVRQLKIQKRTYCSSEKELCKGEYLRLLTAAKKAKDQRLYVMLQTLCGTGIRVSELKFITVEAVMAGEAVVCLKGKNRKILLGGKLKKLLQRYVRKAHIQGGAVFVSRFGNPLDRSNIWKMLKALCKAAKVDSKKVFPHNLRHLFARCFYSVDKDIAKLADVLGHSSINTTRIYIISSGQEHQRQMDALGLVI